MCIATFFPLLYKAMVILQEKKQKTSIQRMADLLLTPQGELGPREERPPRVTQMTHTEDRGYMVQHRNTFPYLLCIPL